ncbi:hypothetical protein HanLR1_Chr14g0547971 [Helianthus annuus]|nr:hypothetical protein HanLR1_Chr14g0547971 [Helianthus annuus]
MEVFYFIPSLHSHPLSYLLPPNPSDMDMNAVFNRLSAIPDEIAQVQYDLERSLRARNRLYTRRRIDEDLVRRQRIISTTSASISNLEERERALEADMLHQRNPQSQLLASETGQFRLEWQRAC